MGQLTGHQEKISSICGYKDTIWSCSEDQTIRVWDIEVYSK